MRNWISSHFLHGSNGYDVCVHVYVPTFNVGTFILGMNAKFILFSILQNEIFYFLIKQKCLHLLSPDWIYTKICKNSEIESKVFIGFVLKNLLKHSHSLLGNWNRLTKILSMHTERFIRSTICKDDNSQE